LLSLLSPFVGLSRKLQKGKARKKGKKPHNKNVFETYQKREAKERNLGSNEPKLMERERSPHISEDKRKNMTERPNSLFFFFFLSFFFF